MILMRDQAVAVYVTSTFGRVRVGGREAFSNPIGRLDSIFAGRSLT